VRDTPELGGYVTHMKIPSRSCFVLVILTSITVTVFSQVIMTNTVPVPIPGATNAVPDVELSKLLISVIVPGLVWFGKWLLPRLAKPAIPILAIVLGAGADYAGSLLGAWQGSFVIGAVLGSAAIGLREVGHQFVLWNSPPSETQNPS